MDFASDFTYMTFASILDEARRLYGHNRHIAEITLDEQAKNGPQLVFRLNAPTRLSIRQLGLPLQFRAMDTRLEAANR